MSFPDSYYDRPWRGLPPELRHYIFTYALTIPDKVAMIAVVEDTNEQSPSKNTPDQQQTSKPITPHPTDSSKCPKIICLNHSSPTGKGVITPLLRLNRESHDLATSILYRTHTFDFNISCDVILHFLATINPRDRNWIRRVRLGPKATMFNSPGNRSHGKVLRILLGGRMMGLESLSVSVDHGTEFYRPNLYTRPGSAVFEGVLGELRLEFEREKDVYHGRDHDPGPLSCAAAEAAAVEISHPDDNDSDDGMEEDGGHTNDPDVAMDALYSVWEEVSGDSTCKEINAWYRNALMIAMKLASAAEYKERKERIARLKEELQYEHRLLYPFRFRFPEDGGRAFAVLGLDFAAAREEYARQIELLKDEGEKRELFVRAKELGMVDVVVMARRWLDLSLGSLEDLEDRVSTQNSRLMDKST